jgi:hypothetical protein
MTKTTRDEINIDIDGSIDHAIAELKRLKKLYPNAQIQLTSDYEYGESYERLKLRFERPKTPVEIELEGWQQKVNLLNQMRQAARAYSAEGDPYPRQEEMKKLEKELGCFAEPMGRLLISGDEIVIDNLDTVRTQNGKVRWRRCGPPFIVTKATGDSDGNL